MTRKPKAPSTESPTDEAAAENFATPPMPEMTPEQGTATPGFREWIEEYGTPEQKTHFFPPPLSNG